MTTYTILVNEIEDLQTLKDTDELHRIFNRAKSTIVQGEKVILARKSADGTINKFDEISTESDLDNYKNSVFKYL